MNNFESNQSQQLPESKAVPRFFYGTPEHARQFLGTTIDDIEQASLKIKGVEAVDLSEGLGRGVFIDTAQSGDIYLDVLGMPQAPKGQKVQAIVLRKDATNGPAIELITTPFPQSSDPRIKEVKRFVLSSSDATSAHQDSKALQWASPGNSRLSSSTNVRMTKLNDTGVNYDLLDKTSRNFGLSKHDSIAGIVLLPGSEGQYVVIRPIPTKLERNKSFALSPQMQTEVYKKHGRRIHIASKVAAALMSVSAVVGLGAVVGTSEQPSDRIVNTAHDLVGDHNTRKINDKPQAEQWYDEATLARSRDAVDAYLKGDMTRLKGLKSQGGYEDNWMDQETISNLSRTKSLEELEAAFNKRFPDGNITLNIPSAATGKQAEVLDEKDLKKAQKTSQDFLEVINSFDRKLIDKTGLELRLVKNLRVGDIDANGLAESKNGMYFSIVLDVVKADKNTAGHEFTHIKDQEVRYMTAQRNRMLNPVSNSVYVGDDWVTAGIKNGRYEIVTDAYGREGYEEDHATIGEAWSGGEGNVTLDRSPVGEKLMNYLFRLEEKYPGATASFLLRARPKIREQGTPVDFGLFTLGEIGSEVPRSIIWSLAALSVLALLAESIKNSNNYRRANTRLQEASLYS